MFSTDFCPVCLQDPYNRSQHSLDYLYHRRKELMAQLEERKVISPPPFAASPTLTHPFPNDYSQEVSGLVFHLCKRTVPFTELGNGRLRGMKV